MRDSSLDLAKKIAGCGKSGLGSSTQLAQMQRTDLPDDLATKLTVFFYSDARDALLKAGADLS